MRIGPRSLGEIRRVVCRDPRIGRVLLPASGRAPPAVDAMMGCNLRGHLGALLVASARASASDDPELVAIRVGQLEALVDVSKPGRPSDISLAISVSSSPVARWNRWRLRPCFGATGDPP